MKRKAGRGSSRMVMTVRDLAVLSPVRSKRHATARPVTAVAGVVPLYEPGDEQVADAQQRTEQRRTTAHTGAGGHGGDWNERAAARRCLGFG